MAVSRLEIALDEGMIALPHDGRVLVFAPHAVSDLPAFDPARTDVFQLFKPSFDALSAAGFGVTTEAKGPYAAVVVMLPRSKAQARDWVAHAMELTSGSVIIDGDKTDGVASVYADMRKRAAVGEAFSKAHGKTFSILSDKAAFTDWRTAPAKNADGFVTTAGVFSADKVDPATTLLIDLLPDNLGKSVVDLGAGWGALSRAILQRASVQKLSLVEADLAALTCARANITDPRAEFIWADAKDWRGAQRADTVVMNPPFHEGRSGDPAIGQEFIRAAAANLQPSGTLFLVANRHLPYEATLAQSFAKVIELGGNKQYKVLSAHKVTRTKG